VSPAVTARRFFVTLMGITGALLILVMRPLWVGLFLALVLASLFWPLQGLLTRVFRGRRGLAAIMIIIAVLVTLVGPAVGISAFLLREGRSGVAFVVQTIRGEGITKLIAKLPDSLEKAATEAMEQLPQDESDLQDTVKEKLAEGGRGAATAVGAAMVATGSFLFQLTLMLIALFFFLVQGSELLSWVDRASPLLPGQTVELLSEVKTVAGSVVKSTVITAGVQAAAALVGYLIAQVPHPFFFATLTFFTAFIPAIGAGSMCVAAAGLLLATGHTGWAIFLAIWGLVIVGLVDNVVKPMLIRGDSVSLNGGVVFFSLIGGLAAFGTVGLLLGPLIVTLFLSMVRLYQRDFRKSGAPSLVTADGAR